MSSLQVVHPSAPSPAPDPPTVDVIFVHGLNPVNHDGHALRTWTHHASGVCWPRDLLPTYIPRSRISVFSYNSNAALATSSATVSDHADSLLDRVQALRHRSRPTSTESPSAAATVPIPIIFVAHSLGGLVVKKALVRARANKLYESIPASTHGLVFFGTPHHGGNGVGPGKIAANVVKLFTGAPKNDIFQHLEKDSVFSKVCAFS